jgi:hypothetical protein
VSTVSCGANPAGIPSQCQIPAGRIGGQPLRAEGLERKVEAFESCAQRRVAHRGAQVLGPQPYPQVAHRSTGGYHRNGELGVDAGRKIGAAEVLHSAPWKHPAAGKPTGHGQQGERVPPDRESDRVQLPPA